MTMEQLAKLAGVSRASVSAVLNNRWKQVRIKKETRDKILAILQKTHYRPSSLGTALVLQRSMLVGVMMPSVDFSFVPKALQAIEDGAESKGYGVVVMTFRGDPQRQEQIVRFMQARQVDGLIFSPTYKTKPPPALAEWVKQGIPAVQLFGMSIPEFPNIPSVYTDGIEIGKLGTKHLLERGHRHIATAGDLMKCVIDGVDEVACRHKHGLKVEHWSKLAPSTTVEQWLDVTPQAIFEHWTNSKPRPTALFFYDEIACPFINIAMRHGVKIPQDLAVIGINDIPAAAQAIVPLTTVCQPKYEQGQAAIEVLFELIDGKKAHDRILQPTLIQRQTT
jgi:DNA-binding LacI/PurR family transcriptional regulator